MGKVVQNDWLPQQLSTNDDDNDDVDKGTNKNSSSEDENQKVGIWPEGGGICYIFFVFNIGTTGNVSLGLNHSGCHYIHN